ncbi:MAG TPA: universal stress protein [Gemmatimonadaceae bacterium]|nr:universal stress protein [Gemmatimonadaceae bacterium]
MTARILVPLDGSAFSARALPTAAAVAAQRGAVLHLLAAHAPLVVPLQLPDAPAYDPAFDLARRDALQRALTALAERLRTECGVDATAEVVDGQPVDVLAAAAGDGVELVVMTTHGRGGVARAWLGSVADALVRRAPVPLLLIRPAPDAPVEAGDASGEGAFGVVDPAGAPVCAEGDAGRFRRVLVPLDGSPLAEEILEPALALGRPGETTFELLRVVQVPATALPPDETFWTAREAAAQQVERASAMAYLDRWAARLREGGHAVTTAVAVDHDPARAILREAAARHADLIALSTNARGGLARLRLGSVADKLVRGAHCPTLVARPRGPAPRA